jgi:hypothetical protein
MTDDSNTPLTSVIAGDESDDDLVTRGSCKYLVSNAALSGVGFEDPSAKLEFLLDKLPDWAKHKPVVELARRSPNVAVPLGVVAGEAIPLALASTLILWTFYCCFAPVVAGTSICVERNYSAYPLWVLTQFVPVLLVCVVIEVRALRIVAVPKIQVLKNKKLLGCVKVPFHTWWKFTMLLSIGSYIEFVTLGAFTGTMWHTVTWCPFGEGEVLRQWDNVWKHSMFHAVPPFRVTILITFSLKLIQLLVALWDALPLPSELSKVHYEVCSDKKRRYTTLYRTLSHNDDDHPQNHGAALMALAQANGMQLVFFDDLRFAQHKADSVWSEAKEGFFKRAWLHAESQANRGIQHGVTGILCKGVQLNMQISIFRLLCSINGHWGPLCMCCISTSVFVNVLAFVQYCRFVWVTSQWFHKMRDKEVADEMQREKDDIMDRFTHKRRWLIGLSVFYFAVFGYAITKLIADIFYCDVHSVWNITGCTPKYKDE